MIAAGLKPHAVGEKYYYARRPEITRVVDISGISQLATLPSKEEIFAKLLWVINAPAQQLVTAMNGVGRNLAVVIDQGVKENKFQGGEQGA